ncbi:hypothetical protein P8452_68334 [Trifolium repens]|nr:hypothetical protein P8452_68334 [Trifolium repens]
MCTLYFHLPRPTVHLRSYIYIFPPQIFVSVSDTTLLASKAATAEEKNQRTGEMENWCEKIFSLQHCNGKVIKELGDIVFKLMTTSIALKALQLASISLVALKFMEKNPFANDFAPFVVMAIMVCFLLLIFYAALLDDRTIATLFPITLIYGLACVWSFGTLRILFQNSLNIAVVNLPLESITTITNIGDGNAPEHPVMGPPTTQQMHVSDSGSDEEELGVVLPPALDGNGGMVDLEMNNVVTMMETGPVSSRRAYPLSLSRLWFFVIPSDSAAGVVPVAFRSGGGAFWCGGGVFWSGGGAELSSGAVFVVSGGGLRRRRVWPVVTPAKSCFPVVVGLL